MGEHGKLQEFDCDAKFDASEVFIDSAMLELQYPAVQAFSLDGRPSHVIVSVQIGDCAKSSDLNFSAPFRFLSEITSQTIGFTNCRRVCCRGLHDLNYSITRSGIGFEVATPAVP
jgi:hypothetical protein